MATNFNAEPVYNVIYNTERACHYDSLEYKRDAFATPRYEEYLFGDPNKPRKHNPH